MWLKDSLLVAYDEEMERTRRENPIFIKYFQQDGQLNEDIRGKLSAFNYLYCIEEKVLWIGIWKKDEEAIPDGFDDDVVISELNHTMEDC